MFHAVLEVCLRPRPRTQGSVVERDATGPSSRRGILAPPSRASHPRPSLHDHGCKPPSKISGPSPLRARVGLCLTLDTFRDSPRTIGGQMCACVRVCVCACVWGNGGRWGVERSGGKVDQSLVQTPRTSQRVALGMEGRGRPCVAPSLFPPFQLTASHWGVLDHAF